MSSMTRFELATIVRRKALGDAASSEPDADEQSRWFEAVGIVLDAERARSDEFLRQLKGCLGMVSSDIARGRYDAPGRPGIDDIVSMVESERIAQSGLAFGRAMLGLFSDLSDGEGSAAAEDWPLASWVPEWVARATSNPAINLLLDGLRQALGEHAVRNRRHYTLALRVSGVVEGDGGCPEIGWTSYDAYASPDGFDASMGPHASPLDPLPEPAGAFDPEADTVGPFVAGLEDGPPMPVYLVQWPSSKVSLVTAASERHLAHVLDEALQRPGGHRVCRWRRYPGPVWVDLHLPVELVAVSTDGQPLTPGERIALESLRVGGVDRLLDFEQSMLAAHVPPRGASGHVRLFEASVLGFGFPSWRTACLRAAAEGRGPTHAEALAAISADLRHGYETGHEEATLTARIRHNEDDPMNAPAEGTKASTVH